MNEFEFMFRYIVYKDRPRIKHKQTFIFQAKP